MSVRYFGVETIPVPGMGDSISEGDVLEIVKQPGEYVNQDDILAVIETDKVEVEITAPKAGIIKEYFAAVGDTVSVN